MEAAVQSWIVLPEHCNGAGRLFGGKLMEWIDLVAAVAARRYARGRVTTAAVDHLEFHAPAYLDDIVVLEGVVTSTGKTSMEVQVDSFVESDRGERKRVNRAYLVLVAIGEDGQPRQVPAFVPKTEEQKARWLAAQRRREVREQRRKEGF